MRILLTGGAGFIGSHVADLLAGSGYEVAVVDNLSRGRKEKVPGKARLFVRDLRDPGLEEVFSEFRPEIVDHHAAQISVRDSVADPVFDAEVNILGSLKLLELAVKHRVKKFIFASTGGAVYGEQDYFPADEKHPTRPLSPYAIAKLAVEKYLFFYRATHGLPYVALRYSNVYGPRQDPYGEAGVVAIFCAKLWRGETPVINGAGEQTRDFVYVGDVARANLLALDEKVAGEINIATGVETSINTVFRTLREATGAKVEERHGPPMPGEQMRSVLDPGLAQQALGWEPRCSLKDGLLLTADFFRPRGG
jgi:UDP-glucose 4-epimerase